MWQLRLIILLIGVVFIVLVYLLSRQRRQRRTELARTAPGLDDGAALTSAEETLKSHPAPLPKLPGGTPQPGARQLILALHVVGAEPDGFDGVHVLKALQVTGLHYGQYRVFHRVTQDPQQNPVFSVASLVEPGVLLPENLPRQRLPGLTLFLVLPGPQDGVAACADMLATARTLARVLGGTVLDERRQPLTPESAQQIRQRILDFQQPPSAPG